MKENDEMMLAELGVNTYHPGLQDSSCIQPIDNIT